ARHLQRTRVRGRLWSSDLLLRCPDASFLIRGHAVTWSFREVYEEVLDAHAFQLEAQRNRASLRLVRQGSVQGRSGGASEVPAAEHRVRLDEPLHHLAVADDPHAALPQVLGRVLKQQTTLVEDEDVFEEALHLLDEVTGDDDRARMRGVVGQKLLVEGVAG